MPSQMWDLLLSPAMRLCPARAAHGFAQLGTAALLTWQKATTSISAMRMFAHRAFLCLLLVAFGRLPALAHNGSIARVTPVTGIHVDGELNDWPEGIDWYPLDVSGVGTRPSPEDFQGRFALAYDGQARLLYIAIDIIDDSIVTEPIEGLRWWEASDGCEIYIDLAHTDSSRAMQYSLYGSLPATSYPEGPTTQGWEGVTHGMKRGPISHVYEWAIDLGHSIAATGWQPGSSISLDVAAVDRDRDGSMSWMSWGDGILKVQLPGSRGDALLTEEPTGHIAARLTGSDDRGVRNRLVRFVSQDSPAARLTSRSDQDGRFDIELPGGKYQVASGPDTLEANLLVVSGDSLSRSWLIPPVHPRTTALSPARQVVTSGTRNGHWRRFDRSDGLGGTIISGLSVSSDGDLWVASERGVTRYDGRSIHSLSATQGLPDDQIFSVAVGPDGEVWLGMYHFGAARIVGDSLAVFTTEDGLGANQVMDILIDDHDDVWFATYGGGLSRFDGERFETFTTRDGLASNALTDIAVDSTGRLWCALVSGGVSRLDPARLAKDSGEASVDGASLFTNFTVDDGLTHETIHRIAVGEDGRVWVGGAGGIDLYDGARFINVVASTDIGSTYIYGLLVDSYGQIWAATPDNGLHRLSVDKGPMPRLVRAERFSIEEGLGTPNTRSLVEDHEGNLWVGNLGFGLLAYTGNAFRSFGSQDGFRGSWVLAMLKTDTGEIWVSTRDGGLLACERDTCRPVPATAPDAVVIDMLQDQQGRIWLATERDGLMVMHGSGSHVMTIPDSLVGDRVGRLMEDRHGAIWAATAVGPVRYDGLRWQDMGEKWSQLRGNAMFLIQDSQGNVWSSAQLAAKPSRGVLRFDGTAWRLFTQDDGLPSGQTRTMYEDEQNRLWLGSDSGLSRFNGHRWESIPMPEELGEVIVYFITADESGLLWLGTSAGVIRFDGEIFLPLSRADGLASEAIHKILQDRDGVFWFGGTSGLTRYEPMVSTPAVQIRGIVAEERYAPAGQIRLPSNVNHVDIEFQARSVKTSPGAMVYRYRLGGVDSTWQTTRDPVAEYFDLPLGHHLFEVVAIDRDWGVSDPPARLQIDVHPPYRQILIWSAMSLTILAVGLVLGSTWNRRRLRLHAAEERSHDLQQLNERLQEADELKSDFVSNVSHELRTPLTVIKSSIDNMLDGISGPVSDQQETYLQRLNTNADRLVRLIDDLLDLSRIEAGYLRLNPQTLQIDEFVRSVVETMATLATEKNITLSSQSEGRIDGLADGDRLHQILVNLIANALKFTPERGDVVVSVAQADNIVCISVRDTGPGIPAAECDKIFDRFYRAGGEGQSVRGAGIGLAICRRLVELHGGSIWFESNEGGGSVFSFTLPLQKEGTISGEQNESPPRE